MCKNPLNYVMLFGLRFETWTQRCAQTSFWDHSSAWNRNRVLICPIYLYRQWLITWVDAEGSTLRFGVLIADGVIVIAIAPYNLLREPIPLL
jgi:hypothetical protein